jgi:hypothetical protein
MRNLFAFITVIAIAITLGGNAPANRTTEDGPAVQTEGAATAERGFAGDLTVEQIDRAIVRLMRRAPGRKIMRDAAHRREMAELIAQAADAANVPRGLLTVIAYRESSFNMEAIGAIGEVGLVQVHGIAARGCDLSTAFGQLSCGSAWLRRGFELCGGESWDRALTAYATGKCKAPNDRTRWLVASRMRQWARIRAAQL